MADAEDRSHGTTGAITALNPVRPSPSCRCREVCHRHQCPEPGRRTVAFSTAEQLPECRCVTTGSSAWCSCSAPLLAVPLVSRRSFWGQRTQTGTVSGRRDRNGHDRHVAGGLSLVLLVVGTVVLFALGIGPNPEVVPTIARRWSHATPKRREPPFANPTIGDFFAH